MKLRMMDNDELFAKLEETRSALEYLENSFKMIPESSKLAWLSLTCSIWLTKKTLKHIEEEILRREKENENNE